VIAHALEAFPGLTLSVFFVFCRIGSCLMVVPGFGSPRVPMQVRLFFSLGASVAIFPVLGEFEGVRQRASDLPFIARLACVEIAKGVFIGFMVRFFFGALQFVGEAAASALGIGMNQTSAEDGEQVPALTSFITLTAAALFFITDQHLELLRALIQSYNVFRFGADFGGNNELAELAGVLGAASLVALQVCSPLLAFSIVMNVMFGILNKLAPMVPVYFISPPFMIGGGLILFYFISQDFFMKFMLHFSDWLISG
jgi:flagellar biosynthetic protein FliR